MRERQEDVARLSQLQVHRVPSHCGGCGAQVHPGHFFRQFPIFDFVIPTQPSPHSSSPTSVSLFAPHARSCGQFGFNSFSPLDVPLQLNQTNALPFPSPGSEACASPRLPAYSTTITRGRCSTSSTNVRAIPSDTCLRSSKTTYLFQRYHTFSRLHFQSASLSPHLAISIQVHVKNSYFIAWSTLSSSAEPDRRPISPLHLSSHKLALTIDHTPSTNVSTGLRTHRTHIFQFFFLVTYPGHLPPITQYSCLAPILVYVQFAITPKTSRSSSRRSSPSSPSRVTNPFLSHSISRASTPPFYTLCFAVSKYPITIHVHMQLRHPLPRPTRVLCDTSGALPAPSSTLLRP